MNNKLKPCPFCGSTRVRVMYSDINKAHVVYCTNCKASTNIAVREEDANYLWNKRAEPERKKGTWKPDESGNVYWICSVCGFASEAFGADILYHFCPSCGADMRGENGKA